MNVLSRLMVSGLVGLVIVGLASAGVRAQGAKGRLLCAGVGNPVGVVVDTRCNAYTADRLTGYVFCIPPAGDSALLARVPGTPTALAVDSLRNVFVGTESGRVFMVELNGSISEAVRLHATPVGLDVDRDGGLVVAVRGGEVVKVSRSDLF